MPAFEYSNGNIPMPIVPTRSPMANKSTRGKSPMEMPTPENLLLAAAEMNAMGRLEKPDPTVDTKRLDKMKVVR